MTYGTGTRSYNRSPEKRAMDKARKEATEKYERGEITFKPVTLLLCHCLSFRFSHGVSAHGDLRDDHDWRPWQQRRADTREIWERPL